MLPFQPIYIFSPSSALRDPPARYVGQRHGAIWQGQQKVAFREPLEPYIPAKA